MISKTKLILAKKLVLKKRASSKRDIYLTNTFQKLNMLDANSLNETYFNHLINQVRKLTRLLKPNENDLLLCSSKSYACSQNQDTHTHTHTPEADLFIFEDN